MNPTPNPVKENFEIIEGALSTTNPISLVQNLVKNTPSDLLEGELFLAGDVQAMDFISAAVVDYYQRLNPESTLELGDVTEICGAKVVVAEVRPTHSVFLYARGVLVGMLDLSDKSIRVFPREARTPHVGMLQ